MVRKLLLTLLLISWWPSSLFSAEEHTRKILILHGLVKVPHELLESLVEKYFTEPIAFTTKKYEPTFNMHKFDTVLYCIDAGSGTRLAQNPVELLKSLEPLRNIPQRALVVLSYGEMGSLPNIGVFAKLFPKTFILRYTTEGIIADETSKNFIKWLGNSAGEVITPKPHHEPKPVEETSEITIDKVAAVSDNVLIKRWQMIKDDRFRYSDYQRVRNEMVKRKLSLF